MGGEWKRKRKKLEQRNKQEANPISEKEEGTSRCRFRSTAEIFMSLQVQGRDLSEKKLCIILILFLVHLTQLQNDL